MLLTSANTMTHSWDNVPQDKSLTNWKSKNGSYLVLVFMLTMELTMLSPCSDLRSLNSGSKTHHYDILTLNIMDGET